MVKKQALSVQIPDKLSLTFTFFSIIMKVNNSVPTALFKDDLHPYLYSILYCGERVLENEKF